MDRPTIQRRYSVCSIKYQVTHPTPVCNIKFHMLVCRKQKPSFAVCCLLLFRIQQVLLVCCLLHVKWIVFHSVVYKRGRLFLVPRLGICPSYLPAYLLACLFYIQLHYFYNYYSLHKMGLQQIALDLYNDIDFHDKKFQSMYY